MRKTMTMLLAILFAISGIATCFAEGGADNSGYDRLTVAVTTPMTGKFFTSMWGNNTSDTDVRALIHGYDLIVWDSWEGRFRTDESVVRELVVTRDMEYNHTYTIELNDDLTYSDGTPITAWDYAFSMLLLTSPAMNELGANTYKPEWILGYENYASGKAKMLSGFRVLSDYELAITISNEYLPFFYEMGLLSLIPYPASVIAPGIKIADIGYGIYVKEDGTQLTGELLRETILDPESGYLTHPSLTSGPYVLKSYADGVAEFELNPYYKGDAKGNKPSISHITFKNMAQDELAGALSSNEIQLINKATSAQLIAQCMELTDEESMYTFSSYARTGLGFISFNTDREAVSDVGLRQALALATDRDELVENAVGDYGIRADGYYGMGQWMVQVLNGSIEYPKAPAEGASYQEKTDYEKQVKAWGELDLEEIEHYDRDLEKAAKLLDAAGWNLNAEGESFTAGTDTLRYRQGESSLEPLKLSLAYAEGSAAGEALENELTAQLAEVGIELSAEAIPLAELLPQYYHFEETQYDMFFLATNFDVLYEPSGLFAEDEDGQHVLRTSALVDEELYELAVTLRRTKPGDLYDYCVNWLAFQQRFMEILPALPIYSNMYFDFYLNELQDYEISANISWPQAINSAYFGE